MDTRGYEWALDGAATRAFDPTDPRWFVYDHSLNLWVERWIAQVIHFTAAHRAQLTPVSLFARQLADFDRAHAELPEAHRAMIWSIAALELAIDRIQDAGTATPVLSACQRRRAADFAELRTKGPVLPIAQERAYVAMVCLLIRDAMRGRP